MRNLKPILERLYKTYDFKGRVEHDPIKFPRLYKDEKDIEAAGFIASSLAYGKVELFMPVVEKILRPMGKSPYEFLRGFKPRKHGRLFTGIRYRFQKEEDIIGILYVLSKILNKYSMIYYLFKVNYNGNDKDIGHGLTGIINNILSTDLSEVYGKDIKTKGLMQLFPSPANGSPCKRANLYLRWMVRDRDIDFGIWKDIPKSKLVIPLDTHIKRVSRCLGLTSRKTADWKMAVEITESLKRFDPDDPLKYDFALCHRGIAGICKERNCGGCELREPA